MTLSADPTVIERGQAVVLSWHTSGTGSVSIDGIGNLPADGTQTVSPSQSTTFHLVANGDGGTSEASVRVTVRIPELPLAPAASSAPTIRKPVNCTADPHLSRAGDRTIVLQVIATMAPKRVQWWTDAGQERLDQGSGRSFARIDTGGLADGNYGAIADVTMNNGTRQKCLTTFTIGKAAPPLGPPQLTGTTTALLPAGQPENAGFAVYTYLLVRTRPGSGDDTLRMHNLVVAMAKHGMPEAFGQQALETEPAPAPGSQLAAARVKPLAKAEELAVLYVPVETVYSGPGDEDTIATWVVEKGNYSPEYASVLLARLNCTAATCGKLIRGDGPFLVSTVIRLGENHPTSLFIQDVSGTSPEAAGQWVNKYMDVVEHNSQWNTLGLQKMALNLSRAFDEGGNNLFKAGTQWKDIASFFSLFGIKKP